MEKRVLTSSEKKTVGSLVNLAEVVYQLRRARSYLAVKGASRMVKDALDLAHYAAAQFFARNNLDIGELPDDADRMKLALMALELGEAPRIRPKVVPSLDSLEAILDEIALENGSDEFRELGRLQLFCMRARGLSGDVGDDPTLPVRAWMAEARVGAPGGLLEAAKMYAAWTKEVNRRLREQRRGRFEEEPKTKR